MRQRLPLLLSVLLFSCTLIAQNVMTPTDTCYKYNPLALAGSSTNPTIPGPNVIVKWVHDPSQNNAGRDNSGSDADTIGSHGFDQSTYKCYFFGRTAYRVRFPNGYDPANKYPMVIFLHGAGEAAGSSQPNNSGANRENQDQLYWGAQLFEQRINAGEWNGFLFFPQLMSNSSQWNDNVFPDLNRIIDTMQKYNGVDPDKIITMGLSAGGYGSVNYASLYPQRIAAVISSNPRFIETLLDPSQVNPLLQIPIYMACGGVDNFPGPAQVYQFRDSMAMKGGNIFFGYNPTLGHSSWSAQWAEKDIYNKYLISAYWNNAHKAQPLLYYQNSQFCNGSPISAKMGITGGFYAYEWQFDGGGGFTTIPGASSNTYTATQAGSYRVHFMHSSTSGWSDWSPKPIVISTKVCTTDTVFVEHFETTPVNDYLSYAGGPVFMKAPYTKFNFGCQNGIFANSTEVFTQDGTGRMGGTFMLNNTTSTASASSCVYNAGDQVWHISNPVTVTPFTNYTLNFYMGNNSQTPGGSANSPAAQLVPNINGVDITTTLSQTTLVGDISWKKYSFIWNSGNANYADVAITNKIATGSGNDFVLDEISLVNYTGPNLPAGINSTLWSKAGTIAGIDGNPVKLWTNSDVNSNNLQQNVIGTEPLLGNNANDNINFNPVVNYNSANARAMFVTGGFSGNTVHTAVSAYVVAKLTASQNANLFTERQTTQGTISKNVSVQMSASGVLGFTAGSIANDSLATPAGVNELGKPILWSFSKNLVKTGSNNKQDIRKNGIVVASSNSASTTSFTGNNSTFSTGAITSGSRRNGVNGGIAEIIYILDSNITALKQNQIESYLATKYGTSLGSNANPANYTASDSTTIFWPASTTYQNDVFGIGTDSLSGLQQTISNSANSGSGDGTGQAGKGNLVIVTGVTLMDKRFLMVGNDGANLSQVPIQAGEALPVAVGSTRLNREWKVINTGGVGAVTISFDTAGLGNQAGGANISNYALMIDNDGDGDFSNNTISFFGASSASGKKIIFSGITLNNGVVFTLLTLKISTTLPATWLSFTAEAVNGNALLNWKTGDEINVDRYMVEHSYNGTSFSAIGSVFANNNSGVNSYTYTDRDLAAGTHYYRIRRIDKDGKSDYTDIKSIKIATTGANIQVRPNPVAGSTLVLAVSVPQNTKTYVQVLSVDGKLMLKQSINLSSGSNLVNLNIADVPTGVYLLQVQLNDELITKKFIRSH